MDKHIPIPWVRHTLKGTDESAIVEAENNVHALINYFCELSIEELKEFETALTDVALDASVDE